MAAKLNGSIKLLGLDDIGSTEDIAETGLSFAENASIKSNYIWQKYHLNCFGDDSGLEVEALDNEPGIYSARYAGTHGNHQANIDKVLYNLNGKASRKARFRTVISLIWNGAENFFEGVVEGTIRTERSGQEGFGYDPIFEPDGYNITFAEMDMAEKNRISHRGRAMDLLIVFLNDQEQRLVAISNDNPIKIS